MVEEGGEGREENWLLRTYGGGVAIAIVAAAAAAAAAATRNTLRLQLILRRFEKCIDIDRGSAILRRRSGDGLLPGLCPRDRGVVAAQRPKQLLFGVGTREEGEQYYR